MDDIVEFFNREISAFCQFPVFPVFPGGRVYGLKSDDYKEKKNGQTLNSEDLSAFAPEPGLEPGTL